MLGQKKARGTERVHGPCERAGVAGILYLVEGHDNGQRGAFSPGQQFFKAQRLVCGKPGNDSLVVDLSSSGFVMTEPLKRRVFH